MSTNKKLVKAAAIAAAAGIFATVFALRLPADSTETSGLSRALPVRTATVKIENGYHARRTFTGRAVPGRVSSMAFELGGTVSEIKVDLGSHVKAGDVLAELDTARLKAQRAQLMAEKDEVAASLDLAERTLKRAQETFQNGHTSASGLMKRKPMPSACGHAPNASRLVLRPLMSMSRNQRCARHLTA
ncbi:efflux RND transporter periplasmic adaptor subunit [Kordiimonas gwangyangensis]|uniref:efflux RND transporter periplasmic adaptor subunit n=1 Tax=Kordiimonas gwangyangensis TaxID=288022 RepID=UPI0004721C7A|nr:biotin/lipoyl-binding protein [Kordiimonas gwangyangensis]